MMVGRSLGFSVVAVAMALVTVAPVGAVGNGEIGPRGASSRVSGPEAVVPYSSPAVAYNSSSVLFDQYLVVWTDVRSGTRQIWGRRVSDGGVPLGDEFMIGPSDGPLFDDEDQSDPAVAYNHVNEQYLVVWEQQTDSFDVDLLGQRVRADGTLVGGLIYISTTSHQETKPDVAYNGVRNQFLVVWEDSRVFGHDIFGQRVRGNGNLVGGAIPVTSFATGAIGSEYTPAVAFNPIKNLYQVVWSDSRAVTSWDIYAQRVRGNGNLIGDAFGVATTDDAQHRPDIAFDPYDLEFYVVWQDDRRASWDIYGQLTSSYGRLRGGQRRIGLSPGDDRFPAVSRAATPSSSRYLVVWSGPRKDLTDTDIRGRFVDSKGNPIGPTDFSIDSDTDYQYRPALAHMSDLSTNDYLVAWLNDPDTTHDIWGRVFP